jgi:hypothetical protein
MELYKESTREEVEQIINFSNIKKIIRIVNHNMDWDEVPTEEVLINYVTKMVNDCKQFLDTESIGIDYIKLSSRGFDVTVSKDAHINITYEVDPIWWKKTNGRVTYDF